MRKQAAPRKTDYWLNVVRSYDRSGIKLAALGSDGNDVPFEQAFSNLAHAYLRDAAPSLLDYEVGFQLLDRNTENTKAIGVFGFKVGSHWLYAPVFFLAGDLKGHELLYLKNQDMFVPLEENWLNYILNRKPNILGESVDRNSGRLGVMAPDFVQISRSPHKHAAATPRLQDMVDAVLPAFAHVATSSTRELCQEFSAAVNLPDFLKHAGLDTIECLVNTCRHYPDVAQAIDDFHGLGVLSDAIKVAGQRARMLRAPGVLGSGRRTKSASIVADDVVQDPRRDGKLKMISYDYTESPIPTGLTEEDQEKLKRETLLIKDERDPHAVAMAYNVQAEQRLYNPTESGLYEVLTKPGDFERLLIVMHPQGADRRREFALVCRPGDNASANWENMPAKMIWCASRIEGKEWDDWFKGLSAPGELTRSRSKYILLSKNGDGTCPFHVLSELGDDIGETVYEVEFDEYSQWQPSPALSNYNRYEEDYIGYDRYRDGQRIHVNGKAGSSMLSNRGDVYVPEGYKLLKVKHSKRDDEEEKNHSSDPQCCEADSGGQSDPPPIRPGNIIDAELSIIQKTAALSLYHNGSEVLINGQGATPRGALISLVWDHGFTEKTARAMLKTAERKRKLLCRVVYPDYIKQAAGDPYLVNQGPGSPAFPSPTMGGNTVMATNVPTMLDVPHNVPVPGMIPQNNRQLYNPNTQLDPNEMGQIRGAIQTGQKEIFDTAMIGSMLRTVRDDTMVDRYLGDLTKGMDRLGRILFSFYWHGDQFAERYGKADMPELGDSLRNAFESVGKCILFLKQKTIEPYPDEGSNIDLGPVANMS